MNDVREPSADYSLRILWSLARWIEDKKGRAALEAIAREAGVSADDFDGSSRWVSHRQLEVILSRARELTADEDEFKSAFAYRFVESYGALRYMVWALSPQKICESAARLSRMVTKAGHFEIVESTKSTFRVRYRSTQAESRLICLSRQVPWALGPTMWGLPPAQLTEHSCIAFGDDCCEYSLRWFELWSRLPAVIGIFVGALIAALAWRPAGITSVTIPVALGLIGLVLELRRTSMANLTYANEVNRVMRDLGDAEAETRAEIYALHQRQREWIRVMEQQVSDRTKTLEKVVEGINNLQQSRVSTIRGFSHDLRNPLFVIRGNAQYLRDRITQGDDAEAVRDMDHAALQLETMLTQLMDVATKDVGFVKLTPKAVAIAPLADTLRRRLRALVHGRDIKVSVFCTREAPEEVLVDPLVFDRVVDNLLTNAAKYTQRGSILLEIGGTPTGGSDPGFLTLKLSDTGEGIPADKVERIFRPRGADEASGPQSYGVGLSSVVRLLAQIGGRLDVMSKPATGTTFWAHFPVSASEEESAYAEDNLESMITRVVRIRRAEGA